MAENPVTIDVLEVSDERVYIAVPHPEAHVITNAKTTTATKPTVAEVTLASMVEQAVSELRSELKAELQTELAIEIGGKINATDQKLSTGGLT